jgi:hypothetical protein
VSSNNDEEFKRLAEECYQPGLGCPEVKKHLPSMSFGSTNWCTPSNKEFGFRPSGTANFINKANKTINDAVKERPKPGPRPEHPTSGNIALEDLECLFNIKQKSRVQEFLLKNRYLFPLILEAYSKIDELFHPKHKCALSVVEDPEEGGAVLLLAIQACETDSQAFETLGKFNGSWWLANLHRSKYLMTIDLRFMPAP